VSGFVERRAETTVVGRVSRYLCQVVQMADVMIRSWVKNASPLKYLCLLGTYLDTCQASVLGRPGKMNAGRERKN